MIIGYFVVVFLFLFFLFLNIVPWHIKNFKYSYVVPDHIHIYT